jgi:hypothetical protein
MESASEHWVNQIYATRDVNSKFMSVFHDLLAQPNMIFQILIHDARHLQLHIDQNSGLAYEAQKN